MEDNQARQERDAMDESHPESESSGRRIMQEVVGPDQIAEIVSRWTHIPVTKLTSGERAKLLTLGEALHKRVVGQDEAIESISEAILRSRAGLSRQNQPTGSFMFLGPTVSS